MALLRSRCPGSALPLMAKLLLLYLPVCSPSPVEFDATTDVLAGIRDERGLSSAFTTRRQPQQRLTEAMIRSDCVQEEQEEDLMDLRMYSSNDYDDEFDVPSPLSSSLSSSLQRMRLPESFQDPLFLVDSPSSVPPHHHNHLPKQQLGGIKPTLLSTGTTIAGVCGIDAETGESFVVLGADTRATAGNMVADKRCQKIHCLARNMWACGAGTAADLDQVTRHCRYALALESLRKQGIANNPQRWDPPEEYNSKNDLEEKPATHAASMATACRFFRDLLYEARGQTGANLIVGGVDEDTGIPHIRAIHPHGSMDTLPYAALGSGGLAAMAVVESRYQANLTLDKAIEIVTEAILSGIRNDLGSGSQVDLCVIRVANGRVVSNYTRAAFPEETIPEEQAFNKRSAEITNDGSSSAVASQSTPGVNGFGNYPFLLRSKRLIVPSRKAETTDRDRQWNELLGIVQED
ncbi:beta type-7 [Seminavis robusta]|uniref:Beta type-7 n=1 Tax=Seminavis robusta TaxID=568900 RepID=A0A9N8DDA9_9STRA|nr:beta type-7 [Seminavis robusta]|eukprot:Sro22_g015140.1 beta type-7 (463) ;mRNA; r:19743-21131